MVVDPLVGNRQRLQASIAICGRSLGRGRGADVLLRETHDGSKEHRQRISVVLVTVGIHSDAPIATIVRTARERDVTCDVDIRGGSPNLILLAHPKRGGLGWTRVRPIVVV